MSSHASTRAPKSAATPADDTPSDTTPDRSDDAATTQPVQEARNVVEAIVEVMRLVKAVGKDGRNTQSNYNFRGIDGTMNAVGPAMRTVGLICIPHEVRSFTYGEIEVGAKRTKQAHAQVQMTYRFVFSNAAGEISTLDVHVPGEAMDSGDKATAKAMSVAYRTCLLQSLTLPTQERDPDADTYERSPAIRAEEIRETVEQAKRERDPVGFLVEWGNRIGEQRLAEVELEVNGEATNGAAYLHRVIAYYQAKGEEAAQARAAAAAQEAHEGVTRDVREDTTAPAAPAAPVEQEAPRAAQPDTTRQAPTGRQAQAGPRHVHPDLAAVLDELSFQAEILGIQLARHVQPVLTRTGVGAVDDLTVHHLMVLGNYMISRRGDVATAMTEQGNANGAKVYRGLPPASAARADVLAAIRSGGTPISAPEPANVPAGA